MGGRWSPPSPLRSSPLRSSPQPPRGTRCLAGLRLCCGIKLLKGLKGQALSFPALHSVSADIVRVTWRSRGTHIAEAKPREKLFTVDYLPKFHGRLFIHPTNLSLEIRPLKLGDGGRYEVVVDTLFHPTNPKTFSYLLLVHGKSKEGGREGCRDQVWGWSTPSMSPWGWAATA